METVRFNPKPERSLKAEAARTLVLSTASSAGIWGGMVIVGSVWQALKDRKDKKNETPEETTEGKIID